MQVPYRIVPMQNLEAAVNPADPLFLDSETVGLYGKVRLLQAYQEGWPEVLLVEWPEPLNLASTLSKWHNIYHNAHYDITVIQQQSGTRWTPDRLDDTFLLARLHFPKEEKFSLDETFVYVLGFDPYMKQGLDKKKLQKSDWGKTILEEKQLIYAATDVYFMPALWHAVKDKLEDSSYVLDKSTLYSCLDFQWNGMPVDAQKLYDLYEQNTVRIAELNVPINVNSWQQVRPYIGEDESDDLALARFGLQGNDRAVAVRETRKLRKQNSFLDKFDSMEGRIYGKFKPSARSGRLTSNDQNLQQIPRATKRVFGYAPGAGRVLIYSDYAQLELRTICAITRCLKMEELFRQGEDLHGYTAEMVFGADWQKEHRQISKTYNFNLLYGGGINMINTILLKTVGIWQQESETNRARKRWRTLWREIYAWQQKGIEDYQKGKLGCTPMGRQYKANLMTDQLNIENQGAGAEVSKLALHYMKDEIAEWNTVHDTKLCNFIHDSYIFDAPDDPKIYQPIAMTIARRMQEAWFELSKLLKITDLPMPVEVKVGYNWGDIESDDVEDLWAYNLEPYAMLGDKNAKV